MKKNITINMQGRLYAIDEDAYNLLKQYEDSLRSYFADKDGGNEIVDDIEARIAELFDELKAGGKVAIDIDDVRRIITRMGNPQQMGDTEDGDGPTANDSHQGDATGSTGRDTVEEPDSIFARIKNIFVRRGRHLYRDPQDKKVLGVISGLAHYYGGDVSWWRIIVVLAWVLFLTAPGNLDQVALYMFVVYFALGMAIPLAATPEDRLRMDGKDVNPQNLAEEVAAEGKTADRPVASTGQQRGCLATVGDLIAGLIKVAMWGVFGLIVIVFLAVLTALVMLLFVPSFEVFADNGLVFSWTEHPWVGSVGIISFTLFIVLVIYGVVSGLSARRGGQGMSRKGRMAYIVLLIASLVASMTCGTIIFSEIKRQVKLSDIITQQAWQKSHTHNGTVVSDTDWDYLHAGGWRIIGHSHCNDHYTGSGRYYTGNPKRQYLDSYDDGGQQLYRVERTDSALAPGTYTLTAAVRADGEGAYVYAIADGRTYKAQIPAEGDTGGQIWQDAKSESATFNVDSGLVGHQKQIMDIVQANGGNGFGWSRVTISGIKTKSGRVSYGLTSDPAITGSHFVGTWFSADDFRLARQGR